MDYEIEVNVSIRNYGGGGNLQLSERIQIKDCTFEDMATILKGFHELGSSLKEAKEKSDEKKRVRM